MKPYNINNLQTKNKKNVFKNKYGTYNIYCDYYIIILFIDLVFYIVTSISLWIMCTFPSEVQWRLYTKQTLQVHRKSTWGTLGNVDE